MLIFLELVAWLLLLFAKIVVPFWTWRSFSYWGSVRFWDFCWGFWFLANDSRIVDIIGGTRSVAFNWSSSRSFSLFTSWSLFIIVNFNKEIILFGLLSFFGHIFFHLSSLFLNKFFPIISVNLGLIYYLFRDWRRRLIFRNRWLNILLLLVYFTINIQYLIMCTIHNPHYRWLWFLSLLLLYPFLLLFIVSNPLLLFHFLFFKFLPFDFLNLFLSLLSLGFLSSSFLFLLLFLFESGFFSSSVDFVNFLLSFSLFLLFFFNFLSQMLFLDSTRYFFLALIANTHLFLLILHFLLLFVTFSLHFHLCYHTSLVVFTCLLKLYFLLTLLLCFIILLLPLCILLFLPIHLILFHLNRLFSLPQFPVNLRISSISESFLLSYLPSLLPVFFHPCHFPFSLFFSFSILVSPSPERLDFGLSLSLELIVGNPTNGGRTCTGSNCSQLPSLGILLFVFIVFHRGLVGSTVAILSRLDELGATLWGVSTVSWGATDAHGGGHTWRETVFVFFVGVCMLVYVFVCVLSPSLLCWIGASHGTLGRSNLNGRSRFGNRGWKRLFLFLFGFCSCDL